MSIQEQAVALLEAQQAKVKPRSPQWMVGEQLKDICRKEAKKKADTARKAAEEALAAAQKELAELKAKGPQIRELTPEEIQAMTAGEVEKVQAATTERMQALEKQLAQADPDTATFKVLFTSWQETYGKMMEALERIKATDSAKAGKLQGAIRAVVEGMA